MKNKTNKQDKGEEKFVPDYCGSVHPYMGWTCITDESSPQYKLKQECEAYDENGFGKYEALDILLDETIKGKWMTDFEPSLVKRA